MAYFIHLLVVVGSLMVDTVVQICNGLRTKPERNLDCIFCYVICIDHIHHINKWYKFEWTGHAQFQIVLIYIFGFCFCKLIEPYLKYNAIYLKVISNFSIYYFLLQLSYILLILANSFLTRVIKSLSSSCIKKNKTPYYGSPHYVNLNDDVFMSKIKIKNILRS